MLFAGQFVSIIISLPLNQSIFVTLAFVFLLQQRAPGKVLHDAVCNHLNLVEGDYFGLEFPDHKKMMVCNGIIFM